MLGQECYIGLDLSTNIDITAAVPLFPPRGERDKWRFLTRAWIPEANIAARVKADHVPYDRWVRAGYLSATPGDVVDYGVLASEIQLMERKFRVKHYFCDPWRLEYMKQLLPQEIQAKFIEIPQSMSGMSCGMQELDRMFRSREISHPKDPLGRWSFGNVRVAVDGNENMKPMKNKSIERIDPTVALINAMAGAIKLEPRRSVYESRGMRAI